MINKGCGKFDYYITSPKIRLILLHCGFELELVESDLL